MVWYNYSNGTPTPSATSSQMMVDANGETFIRQFMSDGTIKDTALDGVTSFTPINPVAENCPCEKQIEIISLVQVPELSDNSSAMVTAALGLDQGKAWSISITSTNSITYTWVIVGGNVEVTATNESGAISSAHSITVKATSI